MPIVAALIMAVLFGPRAGTLAATGQAPNVTAVPGESSGSAIGGDRAPLAADPRASVRIAQVSPQGEVSRARQIVVRFSESVVPFGDPRLADPVSLACDGDVPAGAGRWSSDREWLYDFDRPLGAGVRCRIEVVTGWVPSPSSSSAPARRLTGPTRFSFSTGGPAVLSIRPSDGSEIAEDQHFVLRLNGAAHEQTVVDNAWCEVEGVGEQIAVRIVSGSERDQTLAAIQLDPEQRERALVVACQRPLPSGAGLRLVWGKGIAAAANPGVMTGTAQEYRYQVRDRFSAEFSCERERAEAACLPIRPMLLRFSAPVPRALAQQVRIGLADGQSLAPHIDKDDASTGLTDVVFRPPFPEGAQLRIELPADLRDDAGRPLANAETFPLQVETGEAPPLAKFASAPFGIVELHAPDGQPPMLPLTLRRIQQDLSTPEISPSTLSTPGAGQRQADAHAPSGQLRVKRLESDAEILQWYGRVDRLHETVMTSKELGRPEKDWYTTESYTDEHGRTRTQKVERILATREVALLDGADGSQGIRRIDLPVLRADTGSDSVSRPFEVIGVPLPEPGYHVLEIASPRLGQALLESAAPMYVRTGVLVTNLGVHFKHGRENSLAWVTTLDRGQPVQGARVAVYDCNGTALWNGLTDAQGLARIDHKLVSEAGRCVADHGLFVTARAALPAAWQQTLGTDARGSDEDADTGPGTAGGAAREDVAFVFSSWDKGIEGWRFNVPTDDSKQAQIRAHTVFDRTLLRAGETVSMKHFVRAETLAGLAPIGMSDRPDVMRIVHEGSGQEFTIPLRWESDRSASSSWKIPTGARLGVYRVSLRATQPPDAPGIPEDEQLARGQPREWDSGEFRVEEFRLPIVDARIDAPASIEAQPGTVAMTARLGYLSGGPMAGAAVRLSAVLKRREPGFADFDGFSFAAPRSAIDARAVGSSADEATEPEEKDGAAEDQRRIEGKLIVDRLALTTSDDGQLAFDVGPLPQIEQASDLAVELSFNDPNGEVQTVARTIALWPSTVVLGLKPDSWVIDRGKLRFVALALDRSGKPIADQPIEVRGRLARQLSSRKRMVGGFYAYDNRTEFVDLGPLCAGTTDTHGRLQCESQLDHTGEVELVASSRDTGGLLAQAAVQVWASAGGDAWFAQGNDDRIDVLPERRHYQPGETARLQVRSPFRRAQALVSVEREGIFESQVVDLRAEDPFIELKVGENWGPNVYVSVLVLRGRIRATPWYSFFDWGWKAPRDWLRSFRFDGRDYRPPTSMVDLAKPAYRFGMAALRVGIDAHALTVEVSTDKPAYQVRDQAATRIRVAYQGKPLAQAEVAFAAVDEALLALRENRSWDLLQAMIQQRAWSVQTSTAHGEIIGRRHYGRKAVAAGGGGGTHATRELFDTLLLWRPRVQLDANGEALIEVPLNDSLTSFRMVAIADAGPDRFGTGSTRIAVSQDLQLISGLPPLVRDADRFAAMMTVRNTTSQPMDLHVAMRGTARMEERFGPATHAMRSIELPTRDLRVAAGSAVELDWPVDVPAGASAIDWEASVEERVGPSQAGVSTGAPNPGPRSSAARSDRLRFTQRVVPAVPVRVLQATLGQLDQRVEVPVDAPVDALKHGDQIRGGLVVGLQPRLSAALPGLRRYFEHYPYTCLEQKAARAIGLRDRALWNDIVESLPTYLDRDGLASYFPTRPEGPAQGSDRLTAHLLAASQVSGFALPEPTRDAMLGGLARFVEGRIERRFWAPRQDLDVRKLAAIEALSRHGRANVRMLDSIRLVPAQWPTAALIDWIGILRRVDGIAARDQRREQAQQLLRARLDYAGTTLKFSTESEDFWWWLMDSGDSNAARLILTVLDDPTWRDELPRLVLGALGRQRGGAWLTTAANLWGSLALEKFGERFEAEPVNGQTIVRTRSLPAGSRDASASAGVDVQAGAAARAGAPARAETEDPDQVLDWGRQPDGGQLRVPWPGLAGVLAAEHLGSGRPWLTVQSLAAIPLTRPLNSGYSIRRSVHAVERRQAEHWSRGDIVRVRLSIDAQRDMTWVVVSDPVPAGATILGSGLGRDSALAIRSERDEGSVWPAYQERAFEAYRSYYAHLPRGEHVLEYTVRLNNPGRFALPPTRVEALYAPETFGEFPNATLDVMP